MSHSGNLAQALNLLHALNCDGHAASCLGLAKDMEYQEEDRPLAWLQTHGQERPTSFLLQGQGAAAELDGDYLDDESVTSAKGAKGSDPPILSSRALR